jgi:hypothetical protein
VEAALAWDLLNKGCYQLHTAASKMHITKIHVNSGTSQVFQKEGRILSRENMVGVWIDGLLRDNRQQKLPEHWPGYSATATDAQGGIVLSVFLGESDLLVQTIAIARHAAHGRPLWRVISALGPRPGCETPPCKTWCAVLEHGGTSRQTELESFAPTCAWFWRTHGSKFSRHFRSGHRVMNEPIFKPTGWAVPSGVQTKDGSSFSDLEMNARSPVDNTIEADGCYISVKDTTGNNEYLIVEVPHACGYIKMTVPRSLLKLCFCIDTSDRSVDCISKNIPLFMAAAYSEYQQLSALSFELTESHIADAQRNMARLEKSPIGTTRFSQ